MRTLNYIQAKEALENYIKRCTEDYTIAKTCLDVGKSFIGKPITKRFFTAVCKALPEHLQHTSYYDESCAMKHFCFTPEGRKYDNRVRVFIAYDNTLAVILEELEERLLCHLLDKPRAEHAQQLLENLQYFVTEYNKLADMQNTLDEEKEALLKEASYENYLPYDLGQLTKD